MYYIINLNAFNFVHWTFSLYFFFWASIKESTDMAPPLCMRTFSRYLKKKQNFGTIIFVPVWFLSFWVLLKRMTRTLKTGVWGILQLVRYLSIKLTYNDQEPLRLFTCVLVNTFGDFHTGGIRDLFCRGRPVLWANK